MNRRTFLTGTGAGVLLTALGLPGAAAAAAAGDRKLVVVFAPGGWDITRVLAPEFDNANVSMEAVADRATVGNIPYVAHPDRPSVDTFLQAHHRDLLVLNGVMVRSIAHEICTMIMMTGTSSGLAPDWPAILADERRTDFTLPHLVIGGPSFPGDKGVAVSRTGVNGQLEALVSGQVEDWSDTPVEHPSRVTESLVDRYLTRRAAARADGTRSTVEAQLTGAFRDSMDKLTALKDLRYSMDFTAGTEFDQQAAVAAQALSIGVSRCVTLSYAGSAGGQFGWDTHADNDALQSTLWEGLFAGLTQLMVQLQTTPGTAGGTLAEETLVVVMSEMGRTPLLNELNGKDHWPYTSVMMLGQGITGDRVVGGFDDTFYGRPLDPASAEIDEGGQTLSAEAVGATLLQYAGVDPEPYISGVKPIEGVLT